MKGLENLPEIASRQLGGLNATPKMLGEIKLAAARQKERKIQISKLRPVAAVCMALLLCVGIYGWTADTEAPVGPVPSGTVLDSQPAGNVGGNPSEVRALLDVPIGSISLGGAEDVPTFRSLFVPAQGSNFPMILLSGAAYRLLEDPASVSDSLLGESLGQVEEYTLEPALGTGGIISNTIGQGEAVYAISGMTGAMIAAPVNGTYRAFQRVSFAGAAVIGNESLEDTLCPASQVLWMELSGVGAVDDAEAAQSLMETLLDSATYQSASVSSGGSQSLLIGMKNGLTLQLMVADDAVSACGSWSCPEFFEAFLMAME